MPRGELRGCEILLVPNLESGFESQSGEVRVASRSGRSCDGGEQWRVGRRTTGKERKRTEEDEEVRCK